MRRLVWLWLQQQSTFSRMVSLRLNSTPLEILKCRSGLMLYTWSHPSAPGDQEPKRYTQPLVIIIVDTGMSCCVNVLPA